MLVWYRNTDSVPTTTEVTEVAILAPLVRCECLGVQSLGPVNTESSRFQWFFLLFQEIFAILKFPWPLRMYISVHF